MPEPQNVVSAMLRIFGIGLTVILTVSFAKHPEVLLPVTIKVVVVGAVKNGLTVPDLLTAIDGVH